MGNFNRGSGFKRGFGGGRDDKPRHLFPAICSECGNDCQVPFKPSAGRSVLCSNCFDKQGGGERPNRFGGDRHERPRFNDRQKHDAVCAKCGNDCKVPFRPTAGKPIFCDNCFEKPSGGSKAQDNSELLNRIKAANDKLDKIMKLLTSDAAEKVVVKTEKPEVKETEETKIVKEKKEKKVTAKKAVTKKKK